MPTCSAANCKNKHEDGVRLFRWPSAPERARLWLEKCGRAGSGWQPKPSSRLCENHFDRSQFEEHRQDGWRKLKPNAVPTLFSNEVDSHTVRRPRAKKSRTVTSREEERGIAENSFSQRTKLTTDIKEQKEELLCNIVLDLQVSGEQDTCDVEPDNSSDADQLRSVSESINSHRTTHPKCSDSKQEMEKNCCASDVTQNTGSPAADSRGHEHLCSDSQHLLKQMVYQCPLCDQLTMSLKLLLNHLAKHRLRSNLELQSESGRYCCTTCGKGFSRAGVLASHIHVVHQGMKAGDSRKNSKSPSRLPSVEANQQRLLCAVCGRQFVHIAAFQRHSRSHVAARDRCYMCSVCGHRTTTAGALHCHTAVHISADQRPLACAHCDRRFVRAGDLRKHVRVHTGDRPYRCSVCGRAFSRTYSLLAHGRTHAAKSALHPCVICRQTFRSAAGLAAHRRFCVRPNN